VKQTTFVNSLPQVNISLFAYCADWSSLYYRANQDFQDFQAPKDQKVHLALQA